MFRFAATRCVTDAAKDACDIHDAADRTIGQSELVYRYLNIIFTVLPRPAMTWNMVCWMLGLVIEFFTDYEPLAFIFDVEVIGVRGLVASGNITAMWDI